MSPELIAILAVGVALAGLILNGQRGVNTRLDGFDERLRAVETGIAEVKGQLTIVRDYISGRNARGQGPTEAGAGD